jgi:hypothetical protein
MIPECIFNFHVVYLHKFLINFSTYDNNLVQIPVEIKWKPLLSFTLHPVSSFLASLSYLYLIPSFIL